MPESDVPESTHSEPDATDETWSRLRESIEWRALELGDEEDDEANSKRRQEIEWLTAEVELLERMPVELRETSDAYRITACLPPEFTPEDVEVSLEGPRLAIQGYRGASNCCDDQCENDEGDLVYSEFDDRRVFREIELPEDVDASETEVEFDGSALRVTVPR